MSIADIINFGVDVILIVLLVKHISISHNFVLVAHLLSLASFFGYKGRKIIVTADFNPADNKWRGFSVEMGVKGTHENYNVIYNGHCHKEYFNTKAEALSAARNAIK